MIGHCLTYRVKRVETSAKLDEIGLNGLSSPANPTNSRESGVDGRP